MINRLQSESGARLQVAPGQEGIPVKKPQMSGING